MTFWAGVIERLPVSAQTPIVTLHEGTTPLIPVPRLAEATDPSLRIFLKCEGFNPPGLKDPDTALESASRPGTLPARLDAVLAQIGL